MTQANKAKEQTKIAEEDEKNKLNNYEDIIDEYTNPEIKALKIVINSGSDKKVGLPIESSEEDNYVIDWGDGTTEEGTTIHTYPEADKEYTVTINGILKNIYSYASETTRGKIIKIEQWGETELEKIDLIYCRNLIEIARPTKNSFVNLTSFSYAFDSTGITSIPEGLFANCPQVTDFSCTFRTTRITSIPEDLFANCPNATNFEGTFSYTGTTSIPEGLFANCPNATDFTDAFAKTRITSIPEDLFANCSNATDFSGAFKDTDITTIPEGLFVNCQQATSFGGVFENTGITNIPEKLFKNCSKVESFMRTFDGCKKLENALPLWNSDYYNEGNLNVSETTVGLSCYSGCTVLLGSDDIYIPDYWKQETGPE